MYHQSNQNTVMVYVMFYILDDSSSNRDSIDIEEFLSKKRDDVSDKFSVTSLSFLHPQIEDYRKSCLKIGMM